MNKNKYTVLAKIELLETSSDKTIFVATNALYYLQK